MHLFLGLSLAVLLFFSPKIWAEADVLTVNYPASDKPGELRVPSTFHAWFPPKARKIKAVIVHQHGCGDGAENSGETAALDLHWRALARRHDAILLSPHYRAGDKGDCRQWCDPRNGSDAVFQKALADLGEKAGHPELETAPWCLWGHSGGGFWASLMLEKHAEKIVAIFCRSGAATYAWTTGQIKTPDFPAEAFAVPVLLNPGIRERGDKQFDGIWKSSVQFFEMFRAKGAPVAFAPDPFSNHDCRNSRLLAIPYFDACLGQRLNKSGHLLKPVRQAKGFAGDWQTGLTAQATAGSTNLSWLPDRTTATAFNQYVKTGVTRDLTPPASAPVVSSVKAGPNPGEMILEWTAEADFESGIREFRIFRDGNLIATLPEKPITNTGFPQFQGLSYHDTPIPNPPAMRFTDTNTPSRKSATYSMSFVNGGGLESPRSKGVRAAR